ncbi:DNA-binding transcriptional regulator, MarR family [Friedmanniella luteola]|uniref:DNA-binding transcriptional regulator, MarR family n=1 Tax=Friedmanniella luteola TaxID=546871 RepID=A0A1H1MBD3_9ACTN|nr:MarR family transcriptional regulator [Friedmanniella luteola]SDR83892.1 DNA-binding transcriptional regulator, MarR family [Friedmanniella luteola]
MVASTDLPPAATAVGISLDQQLCLALYTASRAMTARYRVALSRVGLTYPQYLVMLLLWEEGSCSVGGIGHRLSLDSSTLSPLLKRLQAMGLVTRTRAATDERLMIIGVTPRGAELESEAAQVAAEMGAATGQTPEEYHELTEQLRALTVRLEASTAEAVARGPEPRVS